ncbi:lectizyme-like [Bradysia coprophila]|uniref:lectizyme-like n=1 Tax=Bradysia coprophila TaxID=38358 RepID=UPI00187D96CA|nr:lectizyme-like [Bradysia coprophila]
MKIQSILVLGVILTAQAARLTSPLFKIHNGILVPTGKGSASGSSSHGRIVGGGDAEMGSAPWMVSLQWGIVRPSHFCGGTIINPNWVLTAGHCVQAFPSYGIAVVIAGLHNLSEFGGTEQVRHVTRSNMWSHEEFNDAENYYSPHDIGLLVFQTPFAFDYFVNAIALPSPNEMHTGMATLHGWGSNSSSFYPTFPDILQTVDMPIIPIETCRSAWNLEPELLHDNHICGGLLGGAVSACDLDRGGALTQNEEIVGIVSFGHFPCAQPDIPSVYVRVSAYISWIEDTIDNVQL